MTCERQNADRGRRKRYPECDAGALSLAIVGVHRLGEGGGKELATLPLAM